MSTPTDRRRIEARIARSGWAGFLLCLAACCSRAPEPQAPAAAAGSPIAEPCELVRGSRFRSVASFPAGLGPDGPVMGHQYVSFSADGQSYEWTYEDMVYTGACSCSAGTLQAAGAPFTEGREIAARVDAEARRLTWNGVEFVRDE